LDRTRRLAESIMERHPEAFSADYDKNKQALEELAIIPSKQLRNHLAGYIAKSLRTTAASDKETPEESKAE
jgi:small subunit ribosomal protein S17e